MGMVLIRPFYFKNVAISEQFREKHGMIKKKAGVLGVVLGAALGMGVSGALATGVEGMMDVSHLNSAHENWAQAGTHEYYVVCTSIDDYITRVDGPNLKETQMTAYQESITKAGGNTCWPVWRGMVKK